MTTTDHVDAAIAAAESEQPKTVVKMVQRQLTINSTGRPVMLAYPVDITDQELLSVHHLAGSVSDPAARPGRARGARPHHDARGPGAAVVTSDVEPVEAVTAGDILRLYGTLAGLPARIRHARWERDWEELTGYPWSQWGTVTVVRGDGFRVVVSGRVSQAVYAVGLAHPSPDGGRMVWHPNGLDRVDVHVEDACVTERTLGRRSHA